MCSYQVWANGSARTAYSNTLCLESSLVTLEVFLCTKPTIDTCVTDRRFQVAIVMVEWSEESHPSPKVSTCLLHGLAQGRLWVFGLMAQRPVVVSEGKVRSFKVHVPYLRDRHGVCRCSTRFRGLNP